MAIALALEAATSFFVEAADFESATADNDSSGNGCVGVVYGSEFDKKVGILLVSLASVGWFNPSRQEDSVFAEFGANFDAPRLSSVESVLWVVGQYSAMQVHSFTFTSTIAPMALQKVVALSLMN
jgi:hypothetical protein